MHKPTIKYIITLILVTFILPGTVVYAQNTDKEIDLLRRELKDALGHIQTLEKRLGSVEKELKTYQIPAISDKVNLLEEKIDGVKKSDVVFSASGEKHIDKIRAMAEEKYAVAKALLKGFEYHGYLRSGFAANGEGGDQVYFEAPGAGSKYRLGNETDTYGELRFVENYSPEEKGPFFKTDVLLSFSTEENNNDDKENDKFSIRESYAQMGNFDWAPGVSFWAGQRFYRRHDIYMIDYYYLDTSGYGGGVEGIKIGDFSKLAVAYLGGSIDTYEFPKVGRVAKNSIDIRLYDIDMPLGKGVVWLYPSAVKGGSYTDTSGKSQVYNSAGGFAGGFMHIMDKPLGIEGYNNFSVQYGTGSSAEFTPTISSPDPKLKNRRRFRITNSGVIQPNEHFSTMYTFVYQAYDNGMNGESMEYWTSGGLRPIYFFNENVALAFEFGMDNVTNQSEGYSGTLCKMTLAPELRFDNTFFGRPVVRAYATYALWSNGFKGRVGQLAYEDETAGLTFGLQMESWW